MEMNPEAALMKEVLAIKLVLRYLVATLGEDQQNLILALIEKSPLDKIPGLTDQQIAFGVEVMKEAIDLATVPKAD